MYILLALIGYTLLALVLVLDKFILTKSVTNPAVYTFYSTIFLLPVLLVYPFGVGRLVGMDWVWALVSGLTFGAALWTMFIAVKRTEATHMNPFIAAMTAVATFALTSAIFHEILPMRANAGIFLLVFSCLLLSFEVTSTGRGLSRGYWFGILSGMLFAVSHVAAKHIYLLYPFWTGFIWTRAAIGIAGLLLLLLPTVRHQVFLKSATHLKLSRTNKRIVLADKALGIVSAVLVQAAIAMGSVTIVNALVGVEFMVLFLIIYAVTKIKPDWLNEYFTSSEIFMELFAIVLIIFGSLFLIPSAL